MIEKKKEDKNRMKAAGSKAVEEIQEENRMRTEEKRKGREGRGDRTKSGGMGRRGGGLWG